MPSSSEAPPTRLIEEIANGIHAKILSGEYPPGAPLKQELLAAEFAVSRTPIREALSRLEAKGVVTQAQGRSAVVRVPSRREVTEMYQVRAELEGLAAQLAAKWISDRQLMTLRSAHDEFVSAVQAMRQEWSAERKKRSSARRPDVLELSAARWVGLNTLFHETVCDASNNEYLAHTVKSLSSTYARTLIQSSTKGLSAFRIDANVSWHEKILGALEAREPSRARRAMTEHIIEAGELVGLLFESSR